MARALRPATFVVLSVAAATFATAQEPVRLELRIVPQMGLPTQPPGEGVRNLPLTTSDSRLLIPPTTRSQRFTLQYRVLDLDVVEQNFVPAGLSAASITLFLSNAAAGTLDMAQLTRFQGVLASTIPPGDVDTSGLPTGPASVRRGLHAPFRGGFADQNNNSLPVNGTVDGHVIARITPVTLSQPNQGNANNGLDNLAWYGLYSFDYFPAPGFVGIVNITARADASPDSGNRFGWFNDGIAAPAQSSNATNGIAYLAVIPSPTSFVVAALPVPGLLVRRRR